MKLEPTAGAWHEYPIEYDRMKGDPATCVASAEGRGFCPSCMGRRMAETAANLVDHVLPRVPLRQFVFTVPFELRARLAYDGKLLGAVGRIFVDSVLGFNRRKLREVWRAATGQSGAVTVVQRCSSHLRLNPHFHSIVPDGVFVPAESGELEFHALPSLTNADVAELLQTIRVRVLAYLEKRGVIESRREPVLIGAGSAEHEPPAGAGALAACGCSMTGSYASSSSAPSRTVLSRSTWIS
jgi:hypothetical protein